MLFVLCFNIAIPLVAATGIFGVGPGGTSIVSTYLTWGVAAAALTGTGVTIMGFSFKLPAVISIFAGIYGASIAGMGTILYQLHVPSLITTALTTVAIVVGVIGLIQIAGGGHVGME